LSSLIVPAWALVYWNASASPAGLESAIGWTACVPTSRTLVTGGGLAAGGGATVVVPRA